MELISWNIQWGRGADGRVDLARQVQVLRAMADADVLCLQEVTRGFGELRGEPGADQVSELTALLPGYRLLYAPAVERRGRDGALKQFGNLIATRLPVREVFRHALPWPADPEVASMPRVALEATVEAGSARLRVICTHLEYYSATQRTAQAEALRDWHAEACAHARRPGRSEQWPGPFTPEPRPVEAILCGDFNSKPDDVAYRRMLEPFDDDTPAWRDAWLHAHPGLPHAPTCALHDKEQWPEPPFACDFMLVTEPLVARIRRCEVNADTDASDHQPILLSLDF
ncbi:endonuclease/exonuclease/phosphatase family metal-dependent hydrolase [Cupriavidus alkaliphilus]|uniref:endonuclease/exonuclease/phosphatase family protein n=1 Tax=Cupriavidus alkaliphilus TaxID=942866 RepID=UPI000DE75CF2|nr:endonuclease/exonuclease/phosphatase family protein [Cupriavidus alkaliphilus]PVY80989.1 endonuclease/exonuclease/phosphatase family metal-dependent hydrolase [Cupriavidus alkaliphilus]